MTATWTSPWPMPRAPRFSSRARASQAPSRQLPRSANRKARGGSTPRSLYRRFVGASARAVPACVQAGRHRTAVIRHRPAGRLCRPGRVIACLVDRPAVALVLVRARLLLGLTLARVDVHLTTTARARPGGAGAHRRRGRGHRTIRNRRTVVIAAGILERSVVAGRAAAGSRGRIGHDVAAVALVIGVVQVVVIVVGNSAPPERRVAEGQHGQVPGVARGVVARRPVATVPVPATPVVAAVVVRAAVIVSPAAVIPAAVVVRGPDVRRRIGTGTVVGRAAVIIGARADMAATIVGHAYRGVW